MVRVKYRYILAEILPDFDKKFLKFPLKEYDLRQAILNGVQVLHGDYGLACIHAGFSLKMYNPATRVFIVRVRRKFHSLLGTTMPMITSIGNIKLTIRTLHLSGTIRCAYKYLINFDQEKLNEIFKEHKTSPEINENLTLLTKKCQDKVHWQEGR